MFWRTVSKITDLRPKLDCEDTKPKHRDLKNKNMQHRDSKTKKIQHRDFDSKHHNETEKPRYVFNDITFPWPSSHSTANSLSQWTIDCYEWDLTLEFTLNVIKLMNMQLAGMQEPCDSIHGLATTILMI